MVSGNVERMAARWELTSVDHGARTLVSFQFLVEPDLPFPASVMTGQNVAGARRTIGRLRARLNEPRFAVAARRASSWGGAVRALGPGSSERGRAAPVEKAAQRLLVARLVELHRDAHPTVDVSRPGDRAAHAQAIGATRHL